YLVKRARGKLMLRIDDMDSQRIRPAYIEDMFRSLEWLGIEWEEGPTTPDEFEKHHSQHHRLDLYQGALDRLEKETDALFGCSLSRKEIKALSIDGRYPAAGPLQQLPLSSPDIAWRFKTAPDLPVKFHDHFRGNVSIDLFQEMRGFVIRRKDGLPAYQLTSLVDDLYFGINTIIRGEDLLPSTAAQLAIAKTLGRYTFSQVGFYHHPLITDSSGQKLSKSAGSSSLKAMREAGIPVSKVYHTFCKQCKWPLANNLEELVTFAPDIKNIP
ncbi:MAG: glutamate--tRNA ligase family protein, partial [Bacteroidota bacterium]